MSSLSTSLLDFILGLLRDPQAASAFSHDPQAALSSAGLGDVCSADVKALMPMLADYAPVGASVGAGSLGAAHPAASRVLAAHRPVPEHAQDHGSHDHSDSDHRPEHGQDHGTDHGPDHGPDHDGSMAIEHIRYIQANYSYTSNTTTVDASHSIWGDSYKIFGDDNVVATHGSVAAGDDIGHASVDNSNHVDNSTHVAVTDSFNPETTDVHGTGNAVGGGTVQGSLNTDHSFNTDIADSGNTQTGTGNVVGEHNTTDTENSGNSVHGSGNAFGGNADSSTTVRVTDSGNTVHGNGNAVGTAASATTSTTNTDLDLHTGDIVTGNHDAVGNEVDTHVDTHVDSHDDNAVDSHDDYTTVSHSFDDNVVAGHTVDQSEDLLSHNDVHLPVA